MQAEPLLTLHEISEDGKIWSKRYKKYTKPSYSREGYQMLKVRHTDGKYRNVLVHRLVAKKYIHNPDNLPYVNHIDGNKKNNNVTNLEWCTAQYNREHYTTTTDKFVNEAKAKLHADAIFISLERDNNRSFITYNCRICNKQHKTRLDSTIVDRGLCYVCAKKKEKGGYSAKY